MARVERRDINFSRIQTELEKLNKAYIKVGYPVEGEVKPPLPGNTDSDFKAADNISEIAAIALWQEFGTSKGIPERPFMRNSFNDNVRKYRRLFRDGWEKIKENRLISDTLLEAIRDIAIGDIQEEIINLMEPGNADITIERKKGTDNPLIHYGQMLQSTQGIIGEGQPE